MPDLPDLPPSSVLPPSPRRGPLRRALRVFRIALECLAALAVVALALSPYLSHLSWGVDLVANFTAQAIFITAGLVAWAVLFRRWKLLIIAVLAGGLQVYAIAGPRAAWVAPADGDVTRSNSIRVLHYNVNPFNKRAEDAARLIESCDADLICIIEPPRDLIADIIQKQRFAKTHPYMTGRSPKDYANWQFVLSKWPTREVPLENDRFGEPPLVALVVEHPVRPFGFVLIHPASPRNPRRWSVGNDFVKTAIGVIDRMRADGLDLIMTADLNGSATSYRGRLLARETDLRRTKPLWRPEGTFPAGMAWPAAILLDDVWVTDGFKAASWETVYGAGSDHRAVLADVVLNPSAK